MEKSIGNRLTGAAAMVRMLDAHGVKHMSGLCGDATLQFYDEIAHYKAIARYTEAPLHRSKGGAVTIPDTPGLEILPDTKKLAHYAARSTAGAGP